MVSNDITVRRATPADIPAINEIHKYYVENSVITFVMEPNSDEAALENYNKVMNEGLPYLVAASNIDGKVLGYAYVVSFRGVKRGYVHSLELSLFCDPNEVRKGVGKQLLLQLIDILKHPEHFKDWYDGSRMIDSNPRQLIACMAIDVDMPSGGWKLRDWYLNLGFEQKGHLKEVGWKKGQWVDTLFLQLQLSE